MTKKNIFLSKLFALVTIWVLVMAVGAAPAKAATLAVTGTDCNQYDSTSNGNYQTMTNYWNKAGSAPNTECINITTSGFSITTQDQVCSTSGAPCSYPAIYIGCHYSTCSPNTNLPMMLSQISAANTSTTETFSSGTFDASYDIWINADTNVTGVQDTEIMIWLNHNGSIQPIGSQEASGVSLAGKTWNVWSGSNGQNNVVSYVATSAISSFSADVKLFINDAIARHSSWGNSSWYLTSIQDGFEPWSGGTGLAITNFSASVTAGGGGPTLTPTKTNTPTGPTATPSASNFLTNVDMESGTTNWVVNGVGTLSSDTTQKHGGSKSIKITGRTGSWNGIGQNVAVSKFPTSGQSRTVSIWVRSETGTPTAKASLRLTASTTTYVQLASAGINSTGWTLLTGTVPVSWSGTLTGVLFYVETAAGTDNIYIDDASLK